MIRAGVQEHDAAAYLVAAQVQGIPAHPLDTRVVGEGRGYLLGGNYSDVAPKG